MRAKVEMGECKHNAPQWPMQNDIVTVSLHEMQLFEANCVPTVGQLVMPTDPHRAANRKFND